MKIKLIGILIALLAMCVVFAILIPYTMKEPKLKQWPQTVNLLCCVLDDFDGLNGSEPDQFVLTLRNQSDSLSINKTLVILLQARTNNLRPLNGYNLSNGVFHDAWGTPLLFALTNNATNTGLAPLVNGHPRPFVVWSAGPNCINEFGSGDDVVPIGR
jgi:hypothetical protein